MRDTIVRRVGFTQPHLDAFVRELRADATRRRAKELLLDYPTVYVVREEHSERYDVYVGETTDIFSRTIQHLKTDPASRDDWRQLAESEAAEMLVIGNAYFNKSLTLDVENRLMLYLTGVEAVKQLHNRRSNPQRMYYSQERFDEVFSEIWRELGRLDKKLFPAESIIRDSALFKASPFHKLTDQQLEAKRVVHREILDALVDPALSEAESGKLIVVQGAAGTGKTVLISSLFYELFQGDTRDDEPFAFQDLDAYLLVNHDEQLTVYQQIAAKLGLDRGSATRVSKPTTFITNHSSEEMVDVVLVDEAHLLWTQGKQSYRGKHQLKDLMRRAKVVVAVYDPEQAVATNQYWEPKLRQWLARQKTVVLDQQMRIASGPETWLWLRRLIDDGLVTPIPEDEDYEIRVFKDPAQMHAAIKQKASTAEQGLSRLLATYDWDFVAKREAPGGGKWQVEINDFRLPWNLQVDYSRSEKGRVRGLSWAEQPATVDEVGSIYTIQGFDLNYAGVIIGPSVKFVDGRVVCDREGSSNPQAVQRRSFSDGTKVDVSNELLRNQLNVLLTRGVHGLYIYACDPALQDALLDAQSGGVAAQQGRAPFPAG